MPVRERAGSKSSSVCRSPSFPSPPADIETAWQVQRESKKLDKQLGKYLLLSEEAAKRKAQLASVSSVGSCLPCLPGARGSASAQTRARGERSSSGVPEGLHFTVLKEPVLQFLRWISSLTSHRDLAASRAECVLSRQARGMPLLPA